MSARIEWINAANASAIVFTDNMIPAFGSRLIVDHGNTGLYLSGENGDGALVEGTAGELLEFLSTAVAEVSAHLAGQQD